jgi:hypothetical protein
VSKAENPLLYYAPGEEDCYDALPEWIRKKIDGQIREDYEQPQTNQRTEYDTDPGITDDDIPF